MPPRSSSIQKIPRLPSKERRHYSRVCGAAFVRAVVTRIFYRPNAEPGRHCLRHALSSTACVPGRFVAYSSTTWTGTTKRCACTAQRPGGPISIRSPKPLDKPSFGTFSRSAPRVLNGSVPHPRGPPTARSKCSRDRTLCGHRTPWRTASSGPARGRVERARCLRGSRRKAAGRYHIGNAVPRCEVSRPARTRCFASPRGSTGKSPAMHDRFAPTSTVSRYRESGGSRYAGLFPPTDSTAA